MSGQRVTMLRLRIQSASVVTTAENPDVGIYSVVVARETFEELPTDKPDVTRLGKRLDCQLSEVAIPADVVAFIRSQALPPPGESRHSEG